jgi:hypothetical protein
LNHDVLTPGIPRNAAFARVAKLIRHAASGGRERIPRNAAFDRVAKLIRHAASGGASEFLYDTPMTDTRVPRQATIE